MYVMILCFAGWVRGLERVRGLFAGARVGVGLRLDHNEHGDIIVQEIEAGSSGDFAGVCVGDVVAKVDGRPQQVTILIFSSSYIHFHLLIYIFIFLYIFSSSYIYLVLLIYILYVPIPPTNSEFALQTPRTDLLPCSFGASLFTNKLGPHEQGKRSVRGVWSAFPYFWADIYIHTYICVYIYMGMHIYAYAYICVCIYMRVHIYACAYICVCIYMRVYLYLYVGTHIYAYTYICVYIYKDTYIKRQGR